MMKQGFSYQSEVIKILSEHGVEAIDFLSCSYEICLLFHTLVERDKEKKVRDSGACPTCFFVDHRESSEHIDMNFCVRCGQRLKE